LNGGTEISVLRLKLYQAEQEIMKLRSRLGEQSGQVATLLREVEVLRNSEVNLKSTIDRLEVARKTAVRDSDDLKEQLKFVVEDARLFCKVAKDKNLDIGMFGNEPDDTMLKKVLEVATSMVGGWKSKLDECNLWAWKDTQWREWVKEVNNAADKDNPNGISGQLQFALRSPRLDYLLKQ
jgi:chromosome segregation ATPase